MGDRAISRRIEWRNKTNEEDTLVFVEQDDVVVEARPADTTLIVEFLNEMNVSSTSAGADADVSESPPDTWGDLVISRSESGDVLFIDPELYWDCVATLFRAHGTDPHPWRSRA